MSSSEHTTINHQAGPYKAPHWYKDYIPTASEWNNCWSNKVDGDHLDAVTTTLQRQDRTLSDVSQRLPEKLDRNNGSAVGLSVDETSTIVNVPVGAIIVDAHRLRRYGACFDGITDDSRAFNALIEATTSALNGLIPSISFILPAATILLKNPIRSGNQNISLCGQGAQNTVLVVDESNQAGVWQHGSSAAPSNGYASVHDLMIIDRAEARNGTTALIFHFDGSTVPTFRLSDVVIRGFAQGLLLENPPRDVNVTNLTINGPNFTLQPQAGIAIISSEVGKNIFTTSWVACNVFNYQFGWKFQGGGMVEGNRFWCCTAYNGWGMVQAMMNPQGIAGITNYQAVVWDFTSCDWQGFGYALDLKNCRGVRVNGGFYTFNDRSTQTGATLTPPWGQRTSAATNTMFSFVDCADILIENVQFDVGPSNSFQDCALTTFDNRCTQARLINNAINATSPLFCGFELGEADAASLSTNTLKVLHNEWLYWQGGDKVADHGSSQIDLPWIEDHWIGTQDANAFITIQQQVQITLQSSTVGTQPAAQARVTFPTRRYGSPLFKGGIPTITMTPQQALVVLNGSVSLGASDHTGFFVVAPTSLIGMILTINYTACGW